MWVTAGDYAITNGLHHVAKLLVHGEPGYLLWLDGKLITGKTFKTSSAAAQYARRHESKASA